ncbi:MAG: Crp/Fnr family transcriptional regulator [Anaerolineaceae bacterium]|nr:MAG: Crp/Fnr family transcriptional regulator [Anaerolineaceae bacterium]
MHKDHNTCGCSKSSDCNGTHGSHDSCINLVPIFNHLEDSQKDEILGLINSIKCKKGEMLYRAGEVSDSLYILSSGKIKIYRLSESGKEQLVRILRAGDFTGELALFSESIHEAFAEAMQDAWICTIKRSDLQELLLKYPSISLKLLNEFSSRLENSEKQTARFATEKVETRIALFLVEYAEDHDSLQFKLPMSRKDLASYLGTTPETISRKLFELEDAGLIIQKPKSEIEITDLEGLKLI